MSECSRRLALLAALGASSIALAAPAPAAAFNPLRSLCGLAGVVSGAAGKVCSAASSPGRIVSAAKNLVTGHVGGAAKALLDSGGGSLASKATTGLALAAIGTWVLGGAKYALDQTARVLGRTTTPQLGSTWFSSTYWRVAGISALLTLPFLFAAAIQAVLSADLALLVRAAFGYLPLAMLLVAIAAPLAMLLLSATDEISSIVSRAAGNASGHFLNRAAGALGTVTLLARSPFLVFFAGLLTVGAALALWTELLMRASAIYVIVLMLPLAFAAMVWPARRIWAIRAVEVLIALILSKFAIVAVLSLGGAAVTNSFPFSPTGTTAGVVLLGMGVCAPWALLRLLPMAELASGAAATLRGPAHQQLSRVREMHREAAGASAGDDWASSAIMDLRRQREAGDAQAASASALPSANGDGRPSAASDRPPPDAASAAPLGPPSPAPPDAASAAPAGPASSEPPSPDAAPERSPGLGPMWQAADFSWPTLELGPDGTWPPQVWTDPSHSPGSDPPSSPGSDPPSSPGSDPPSSPGSDPPRPTPQPPPEDAP